VEEPVQEEPAVEVPAFEGNICNENCNRVVSTGSKFPLEHCYSTIELHKEPGSCMESGDQP
jgi:hypothetical protein